MFLLPDEWYIKNNISDKKQLVGRKVKTVSGVECIVAGEDMKIGVLYVQVIGRKEYWIMPYFAVEVI